MKCTETRTLLSSYLDGAVTGKQMQGVQGHLQSCAECHGYYEGLKQAQHMVAALGRKKTPPDLALQLRVAMSREIARSRRPAWQGFLTRVENLGDAFLMPVTAGVVSAIVFFGLLIGFFALPTQLQASDNDVPTVLYTPPELRFSPLDVGMGSINADSIVVEAYIDQTGRVQDYRILSGPKDMTAYLPQLNNMLIFTVFRPATSFGQPITGKAVLSFSAVNVKG